MAAVELTYANKLPKAVAFSATESYGRPLAILTTLFFMWGFITCLNDILIPHLKSLFNLSYTHVMLVQFAFFSAYFFFSIPWSKVVNAIGYQKTIASTSFSTPLEVQGQTANVTSVASMWLLKHKESAFICR